MESSTAFALTPDTANQANDKPKTETRNSQSTRERLRAVRELMRARGLDLLWVRSTDRYLNEYVPREESTRVWLTGFTGSVGEALVTPDEAFVFVDGRYYLQADQEVDAAAFTVVKVPLGQPIETAALETTKEVWAKTSAKTIGFEPDRFSQHDFETMSKETQGLTWVPTSPSLVETARGPVAAAAKPIRALDEKLLDQTAAQKIAAVAAHFAALGVDALLVQTLDEIAYLSNLRGGDIAYAATFRAIALCTKSQLIVACDPAQITPELAAARGPAVELVSVDGFGEKLAALSRNGGGAHLTVGYDPRAASVYGVQLLTNAGAKAKAVKSPVGPMKAKKGPKELKAMVRAFQKADKVVAEAVDWLCTEVAKRKKVSELDFANKVEALFRASGATGLSFKVISAAGRNGAVIHYSQPNAKRLIKQGELMLLDTGAFYDEGYATDLTRTFLVGPKSQKATPEQKRYFTLTLKAAIAGMRARIPMGTRGDQLDAITRAPLWAAGLNYNHGTGHGVGINVHEFPPRIGPQGTGVLEEGMVFSIEPGVYVEKFGGVRIENLCTLERIKGMAHTLQVKPLTFSPLDARLIDRKLLNEEERAWLAQFMRGRAPY